LAEEFEVSRGPVRETLRILEKDSVVRIPPNRGAHVTQLSIKEVSDIFEVRRTLFGAMIGRLAVEEASALAAIIDADIRALDALARDSDGGPAYFETTFRLSRVVLEACSNDRMAEIEITMEFLFVAHKNPTRYPTYSLVTADPAIGEIECNILLDMNGLMVRSKTYNYGEKFQISTR
jgi:DNA-binding GntR family transcriptional regulator